MEETVKIIRDTITEKSCPKHYTYVIQTDDPEYKPISLGDMKSIVENSKIHQERGEPLFVPESSEVNIVKLSDIFSITLSTSLGATLFVIGFISFFTDVLPNQYFWWTMAFPALGIAGADFLTIKKKLCIRS